MASEQITYAHELAELPNALEDTEIARLMKLVGDSGYKKSEDAPTRQKEAFKPRTLVEIAMEAQQKRDEAEKLAKEKAIKTETIIDKGDIKTQEDGTSHDKLNTDNLSADNLNKDSTASQADADTTGTAPAEQLNSSDKQHAPDEASSSREAVPELTDSENSEFDETSATENTPDGLAERTVTQNELSKAIENAAIRYDEGFRAGVEAGKNEMKNTLEQKFSEQQNTFDALITSLTKMSFAETKELEIDIQAAILSLASERAGVAIQDMPESFLARIEHLMSRVGNSVDSPVITLNRNDLIHITKAKEQSETLSKMRFIEEARFNHGDISINLAGIEIEDILENRMAITPLDSDAPINIEQPNSEPIAEASVSSETLPTMTKGDNAQNEIAENGTSALEANLESNLESSKALEPETGGDKQDIGDKSTDIDNKEELS
ncbi:FliH/SctL family protein [Alphaproteobacteria bacterium]|nr:FliH/SctL family protein [Alphaproteobacteria bacterium]